MSALLDQLIKQNVNPGIINHRKVKALVLFVQRENTVTVQTQQLRSFALRDSIVQLAQSIQTNIHALQANIILQREKVLWVTVWTLTRAIGTMILASVFWLKKSWKEHMLLAMECSLLKELHAPCIITVLRALLHLYLAIMGSLLWQMGLKTCRTA